MIPAYFHIQLALQHIFREEFKAPAGAQIFFPTREGRNQDGRQEWEWILRPGVPNMDDGTSFVADKQSLDPKQARPRVIGVSVTDSAATFDVPYNHVGVDATITVVTGFAEPSQVGIGNPWFRGKLGSVLVGRLKDLHGDPDYMPFDAKTFDAFNGVCNIPPSTYGLTENHFPRTQLGLIVETEDEGLYVDEIKELYVFFRSFTLAIRTFD